jgi:steroid delta-isomerase-like uncharacterized protein
MSTLTTDQSERLVLEQFDRTWNQGEVDAGAHADDFRTHVHLGGRETYTLDEFERVLAAMREAVPDLHKDVEDVVATDEKVALRYTMTGTQEGEFRDVPATGDAMEIDAMAIYRVADGKIAESWIVADFLHAMQQLGVAE